MTKQLKLPNMPEKASVRHPEFDYAVVKILAERERQNKMIDSGKIPHNCSSLDVHPGIKMSVLLEEVGEVAKAINDEASTEDLRTELIQVMAVAMAIYEGTFE